MLDPLEADPELPLLDKDVLPEQRDAVALRYAAGLSAKEIGQVIGKSEAASQKLIQRALVVLREARDVDA